MAQARKPSTKLLNLAAQALPKAKGKRSAAERRAVRLTKTWRLAHPNWNKREGGGAGGQPAAATNMLTMDQINALAGQMAQGDILPQQQALDREQEQLAQSAHQQQALIGNLTQELGGLTAQIAPSIQTAYRQAANDQANWAQGFSGNMQDIANAEAARNAAQLAQLGAPAEQIAGIQNQGEGAGNVLYGQGGYLPATSLGQQGAAMEAFGAQMPGIVSRMGQQDVADSVANQAAAQKDLAGRAADIAAQLPSLRRQYVQTLLGNEMDKLSLQTAMAELGLKGRAQDLAEITSINPNTGLPYGVDAQGNPITDPPDPQDLANDRAKYREHVSGSMVDVLKQAIEDNRTPYRAADPGQGTLGQPGYRPPSAARPADTDAQVKAKLTYGKVFNRIYAQLHSMYGTGNKKWRYGITDAKVRKWIRDFLTTQGIKVGQNARRGTPRVPPSALRPPGVPGP